MVLLAIAATLLQQPDKLAAFEILEEKSPKQKITVAVVSRDGTTAVANDLQNWFILRQGLPREDVKGWRVSDFEPVGVRPDGMIVANRYAPLSQVAIYRGGASRTLGSAGQRAHSWGFSAEGTAYIELPPPTDGRGSVLAPETTNVKVADGDVAEVIRHIDVGSVLEDTELGLLGHWMFFTSSLERGSRPGAVNSRHAGRSQAVYINGSSLRRFEIPSWGNGSGLTSWSDDGLTTFGFIGRGSGAGVPTIWREGSIVQTFFVKNTPANLWLKAFTKDGKMAVGYAGDLVRGGVAVVWREKEGLRTLSEYAAEKKVEIPEGWTLASAFGITSNGSMITGNALNKDKRIRPFRLRTEAPKPESAGG